MVCVAGECCADDGECWDSDPVGLLCELIEESEYSSLAGVPESESIPDYAVPEDGARVSFEEDVYELADFFSGEEVEVYGVWGLHWICL